MSMLRLLLVAVIFISQNTYADTNKTDDDHDDSETRTNNDGVINELLPVEIGVGGELTLQRESSTEKISTFEWRTRLLWESRYVTEGHDNLSGHNIYSVSSEFVIQEIHFVP